jgi:hypothetical protein
MTDEETLAEGHHLLILLNALSTGDLKESRKATYKSATPMVRKALP